MYTVQELMSRELVTLREEDTLASADLLLKLAHIRHLPVVKERKLVGLVTHRDLLRHAALRDPRSGRLVRVRDMMTRNVRALRPEASLREAIAIMLRNKFGCLPITREDGTLVGIITESDLLRVAAERVEELDRKEEAAELAADA